MVVCGGSALVGTGGADGGGNTIDECDGYDLWRSSQWCIQNTIIVVIVVMGIVQVSARDAHMIALRVRWRRMIRIYC